MNGLRFYFSAVRRRDIIKAGEELRDRGKESFGGFEKLPRARIQFRPSWNLPEDENVLIFRFNSQPMTTGIKKEESHNHISKSV